MAFTPLEQDLNIISKLDDEPSDSQGLTPAQLKARFDAAGNAIKAYINNTLLPEMEQALENVEPESCVPMSRTVNGKELSEDIVLTARDVGALPVETAIPAALSELNEDSMHRTVTDAEKAAWNLKSELTLGETAATAYRGDRGKAAYDHSLISGNPHNTTPADIGAAESVHTHGNLSVNGKALSGAVTLTAADVGAVEANHTHGNLSVNGKALTSGITLTLDDVPGGVTSVPFTPAEKVKLGGLGPYTLPVASAGTLGGVRVGAGLTIDAYGLLSATTMSGDVPGDMVRALYDPDGDGVVCAAEEAYSVEWGNVRNKPAIPASLAELNEDSTHRTVTDAEKSAWNLKSDLALGETAATAYRGDRGKIAYEHSQQTGNPHNATPADIGAAAAVHNHGNVTADGKLGSAENRAVYTGTNGILQAGTLPVAAGGTGAATASAALSNLGAVPTSRTVNGKPLSGDITLSAADIPGLSDLIGQAAKAAFGSYVGTGTSGSSNQVSLTFPFVPDIVLFWTSGFSASAANFAHGYITQNTAYGFGQVSASQTWYFRGQPFVVSQWGRTVKYYHNNQAGYMFNAADTTYYYLAIKGGAI